MLSIRTVIVPTLQRGLTNLDGLLTAGQDFCRLKAISEMDLLSARLSPTMMTLREQVQMATDNAKNGAARLAGLGAPAYLDSETDLDTLRARVANTFEYVESIPVDAFTGAATRRINQSFRGDRRDLLAVDYLCGVLIPNFAFHLSIAHAILAKFGVSVPPPLPPHTLDAVMDRYEVIHTGGT